MLHLRLSKALKVEKQKLMLFNDPREPCGQQRVNNIMSRVSPRVLPFNILRPEDVQI
jgi:hypothetical protein